MKTSGRDSAVSLPAASTNELNRQQKQPPAISSVANPFERNIALSTSLSPWSFVIRPTRSPSAVKRCASFATDVVFPEPRNPPIIMYRAGVGAGVGCDFEDIINWGQLSPWPTGDLSFGRANLDM